MSVGTHDTPVVIVTYIAIIQNIIRICVVCIIVVRRVIPVGIQKVVVNATIIVHITRFVVAGDAVEIRRVFKYEKI